MNWKSFRNISDREIEAIRELPESEHFEGLLDACVFALSENAGHPLHNASRDICAAHLFRLVAKGKLADADGYVLTPKELGLTPLRYKSLVRKAFSTEDGLTFKGKRVRFY